MRHCQCIVSAVFVLSVQFLQFLYCQCRYCQCSFCDILQLNESIFLLFLKTGFVKPDEIVSVTKMEQKYSRVLKHVKNKCKYHFWYTCVTQKTISNVFWNWDTCACIVFRLFLEQLVYRMCFRLFLTEANNCSIFNDLLIAQRKTVRSFVKHNSTWNLPLSEIVFYLFIRCYYIGTGVLGGLKFLSAPAMHPQNLNLPRTHRSMRNFAPSCPAHFKPPPAP